MPTATTSLLDLPGARLHHEVRGAGPLVLLAAAPMDAASFAPLADLLASDHLVVTLDPRGIGRSPVDDPDADVTPDQRADDLSRLLAHLDAGPAAVLGSSGGAVDVLALAQRHPEHVAAVVAHEPPLLDLVDDREELHEGTAEMVATYAAGHARRAWEMFLANADIHLPDEVLDQMVAREPQAVADERFQFLHMLLGTTRWRPDVAALRGGGTRVVVGIGEDSAGELCDRTSRALAAALGVEPAMFPGGHIGFVDDPEAFARRLREVLQP